MLMDGYQVKPLAHPTWGGGPEQQRGYCHRESTTAEFLPEHPPQLMQSTTSMISKPTQTKSATTTPQQGFPQNPPG